ncbi:hypothetical protein COA18_04325 [Priestia megaterium]|nr:hypothetical protein COA18_04325 [Priestia megaterium]
MFQQTQLQEVSELKTQIKSQSVEMKEIYSTISLQAKKLSELTPENEILKGWLQESTYFAIPEINEIIRIEKFFPGTIKHALTRARKDFNRNVYFDDFIEGAKMVALDYLKDRIPDEQRDIFSTIQFNSLTIKWGQVREYNLDNLSLVPKDLQDMFAHYIYNGTVELEFKFIEQCKVHYAIYATEA